MVEPAREEKVLPPGEHLVDGDGLADQADLSANRAPVAGHVVARDRCRARVLPQQRGQDPDCRCLSGAVGAEQTVHGGRNDGQIEAVQPGAAGRAAVVLPYLAGVDRETVRRPA